MSSLPVLRSKAELAAWRRGGSVALVPTMGALHAGHLSLVAVARRRADTVLASIFVNPSQFGPNEDFHRYPRQEARDVALLAEAGCDAVYAPDVETIYPAGFCTSVAVAGVGLPLEGERRPGHFAGVATVVAKLLLQTRPDAAVFGEKDFQQLQVIRRLVLDLDLPVEILGAPIVRDADGLALSSRNAYLSAEERAAAPALFESLREAAASLARGARVAEVEAAAQRRLGAAGLAPDYFEARDPETLARLDQGSMAGEGRLLAAARVGATRLIDNLAVTRRPVRADG